MNANLIKLVLGAGFTLTGISLLATGIRENQGTTAPKISQPAKKRAKAPAEKQSQPAPKAEKPAPKEKPAPEIPPAEEIPKEVLDESEKIDNN